jgi:hypothetical protein
MKIPEIDLKLETKTIETKTMALPTRKQFIKKVPRKLKKKLKKIYGGQGYLDWLNCPIRWEMGDIITSCYDGDNKKRLEGLLKNEITRTLLDGK